MKDGWRDELRDQSQSRQITVERNKFSLRIASSKVYFPVNSSLLTFDTRRLFIHLPIKVLILNDQDR